MGYVQQYYWNNIYYNVCQRPQYVYTSPFSFYSTLCLLLQTLTVAILVPLQMVIAILSAQSTQVKYSTFVKKATHCRDQTKEHASLMESGVDIYLSVIVCFRAYSKQEIRCYLFLYGDGACYVRADSVGE